MDWPFTPTAARKLTKKEAMRQAKAKVKKALNDPDTTSDPPNNDSVDQDTFLSSVEIHRAAILANISGKPYDDVKFFAFSRRTRDGAVDTPLPLVANSRLVRKAAPHFDLVFGAGFAESAICDMDAPYPSSRSARAESYSYVSDSDLEDEGDDVVEELSRENDADASGTNEPNSLKEAPNESKGKNKEVDVNVTESMERLSLEQQLDSEQRLEVKTVVMRPGRIVYLNDVAYTTWKAFIFFAYFGELNFAPLKSQLGNQRTEPESHMAPLCSPKSMYRIAHKYNIPSLKRKALADIKDKLSPLNILEELSTTFTSLYSEIRDVQVEYLHSNIKDSGIQARLPTWLKQLGEGELPSGASDIVASLIIKLSAPPPVQEQRKCPYGCNTTISSYCNNGHYF